MKLSITFYIAFLASTQGKKRYSTNILYRKFDVFDRFKKTFKSKTTLLGFLSKNFDRSED